MTRTTLVATLLAVASLAPRSEAQCPRPDFLDGGPCCAPTQPGYPIPAHFRQRSLGICWTGCDVELVQNVLAEWTPNAFPATPCKVFTQKLTIRGGGSLLWSGRVTLQYARTWLEIDPATGIEMQVWRYLANGDLRPTAAAGPIPCPVPPCAPAHNGLVRYTGYVDQVENCETGQHEWAWMMSHVCDAIDHAPGFPRAGVFHPDRSYTFVGPSAGFLPGLLPSEPGAGPFEDVRRVVRVPGVFGLTCEFEEPVDHFLNPLFDDCLCGVPGQPPQWFGGDLGIVGACGTAVVTPGGPFLPAYLSMAIGSWTIPGVYPGVERVRWNAGGYDYTDPCTGITRQEVFFGVTTLEGNPALQMTVAGPGAALPPIFIDQCNSIRAGGGTVMNVPYRPSDHFLNLNH